MSAAINGALVGLLLAAVLFGVEFALVRRRAAERAARLHQPVRLEDTERRQLVANARFCLVLPPAFAGLFWLLS